MVTLSCQVYPIFFTSASMSRRQVLLGRPLFLFPWGFHVRACLVMLDGGFLSVRQIQRHFLRFISISTGSWLVLVHKVLLLTLSDHFTFIILRRHLFTNICILFTVCLVIIHVSELYNITDLTLELNIFMLVFSLISFDFQILLRMRKATRALWIRALVSSSVPPVLLILLPRYVKQSVSASGFPPTVTTLLIFVLAFILLSLSLFILMLSPVCADTVFSRSVFSCICSWLCERRARSSAKSKSSCWLQRVHWIPFLLFYGRFHYPVYGQQEHERWYKAPLSYSCLYLERASKSVRMSNLTCHPVICVAYQWYNCLWYTVVSKKRPKCLCQDYRMPSHSRQSVCIQMSRTPCTVLL